MAVKLFIGGLSFSTSTERLREAFAGAGTVESASVVTDRETGRSRGFGFVEMATPEDAEQAISRLNGTNLDGRTILVEKAKSPGSGGGDRRGAGGGRGGSRGGPRERRPLPVSSPPSAGGGSLSPFPTILHTQASLGARRSGARHPARAGLAPGPRRGGVRRRPAR